MRKMGEMRKTREMPDAAQNQLLEQLTAKGIDVQVTDFSALSFHGQAQAVHQMGLQIAFLAPETSELCQNCRIQLREVAAERTNYFSSQCVFVLRCFSYRY